jgi:hypothetical protein
MAPYENVGDVNLLSKNVYIGKPVFCSAKRTMPKIAKASSVGMGIAMSVLLMLISSLYEHFPGLGQVSWGWPLAWHRLMHGGGVSVFGIYLGAVNWLAFSEDLLFWMILSFVLIQVAFLMVASYTRRKLEIQHQEDNLLKTRVEKLIAVLRRSNFKLGSDRSA